MEGIPIGCPLLKNGNMKIFACPVCDSDIYFENIQCGSCKTQLGFDAERLEFSVFSNNQIHIDSDADTRKRLCANSTFNVCNWLVEAESDTLCKCCQLNGVVPDIGDAESYEKWQKLEFAKHRLVYQLLLLCLPMAPKKDNNDEGLTFDFLSKDNPDGLMTGHANGTITILLNEADSVEREQLRKSLSEPYRTLIGHFRHEVGHYYWPYLIRGERLIEFRTLFGDESVDYGKSLKAHYKNGAPSDWSDSYISVYASCHPWEDWAETWAHYLHLLDTLETAHWSGMGLTMCKRGSIPERCPNPYFVENFKEIFDWSVALCIAGNSLNRSMGLPDIYPFVIPDKVYYKLEFIHNLMLELNSTPTLAFRR